MLLASANKPYIFSSLLEVNGSYVYFKLCSLSISVGILLVLSQMDFYKRDLQENMKTSLSLGILAD